MSTCRKGVLPLALGLALGLPAAPLAAAPAVEGTAEPVAEPSPAASAVAEPIEIHRISGGIVVDGDLSDPAWDQAARVETWYETNPGDNVPPAQRNVGWLGYDDQYLYAAFEFEDPEPGRIRAPLADRDDVPGYTDYGGVLIDATGDGKTAQMFLANPRGVQYDAISSDAAGEDSAPDFFWDSAGRITATGWTLEIRIPFSSLRYRSNGGGPAEWGILLYRNRPRERRFQHFSSRLPRDVNCFICNVRPLVGLEGLPGGGHWVVAPYASGRQLSAPRSGLGSPLDDGDPEGEAGIDLKWLPNPSTAIDATLNPDFSQIESDVAQIAANERFALFFPERRPFFLESVDLFTTPVQAVYTRSITQPRWGVRATGDVGNSAYTVLVGQDEGGGSVILPSSNSSEFARQDFESTVAIGRWRRDLGQSFVSVLYSGREIDGGAYNRVLGPDFRWRPTDGDTISGQLLFSESETPDRPDLADEWDGRKLSGHAAELSWSRATPGDWDFYLQGQDIGEEFRADNGFLPQVGLRAGYGEMGRTVYPKDRSVSRLRMFTFSDYIEDRGSALLRRGITPGFGLDAKLNSFVRFEFAFEDIHAIDRVHRRFQIRPTIYVRPGRRVPELSLEAALGDEIDFANDRLGEGGTVTFEADVHPTDRLRFALTTSRRWLDVDAAERSGRLFTADVARLRSVYNFNQRSWLRLIGQWVETERDPGLYTFEVDRRNGTFSGSAVFAYKLNWQSVMYLGWSDGRELDEREDLQPADRQLFLKVSYAFQG